MTHPASEPAASGPLPLAADDLPLRLFAGESTPLYLQIVHQIKQMIMTHQLEDGAQLPAVRRLSGHLQVNPGTVVQAYRELANLGLAEPVRGRGTLVRRLSGGAADTLSRSRLLDAAVSRLVLRSKALGFDGPETRQRLSAGLLSSAEPIPVVFLGATAAQAERYADELTVRFEERRVAFLPFAVRDLVEHAPRLLRQLETSYTVVAFVTSVPEVTRALAVLEIDAEVLGVTAELSQTSRTMIRAIRADRRYTVVTEPRAVTTVLAQLELESGIDHERIEVVTSDPDGSFPAERLAPVLAGDSVLIFSFGVAEAVRQLALPPERLLELRFTLTASAVALLESRWN